MFLSIPLQNFYCKDKMNGVKKSATPKIIILKTKIPTNNVLSIQ